MPTAAESRTTEILEGARERLLQQSRRGVRKLSRVGGTPSDGAIDGATRGGPRSPSGSYTWHACDQKQACNAKGHGYRIVSSYGWIEQLHAECHDSAQMWADSFGQAFFFGFPMGALLWPTLADRWGRKVV